ncbi:hypothetical protein Q8F55_004998 [Vanrija albida]|uniref:GRIP domain-containing protein n=1 Tax=Vanrija albida TaxID=181172 RepID=A0ABR3Q0M2_9TREE
MFGVSLSDRLKAAVNQIEQTGKAAVNQFEQTGSQLQQRAISATQAPGAPATTATPGAAGSSSSPRPASPATRPKVTPAAASDSPRSPPVSTSPTKSSTSHLAESAIGSLRRSLQLQRESLDISRPGSAELKEADAPATPPTIAVADSSRPATPRALSATAAPFSLGSLASSAVPSGKATPGDVSDTEGGKAEGKVTDPLSVPLPVSPAATPAKEQTDPLSAGLLPAAEVKEKAAAEPEATPSSSPKANGDTTPDADASVEQRLAASERRFTDLSNRYTELLGQSHAANKIVKELTPLSGLADIDAFEGWLRMATTKLGLFEDQLKTLQGKFDLQASRMEELRDTHRLEGGSQTDLISKLRKQLSDAEAKLSAKATDAADTSQLKADLAKAETRAKEEEEKRTKAISLLKTVRQKHVKVEKEKEVIQQDLAEARAERTKAGEEVEKIKAERITQVDQLRKGFERETASIKERSDKELAARKAAWELEMITTKAAHAKELSHKATRITSLESQVKDLTSTKAKQFETIQSRQSEAESARGELEGLQTRTKELEFQLREATERVALLEDAPSARSPDVSDAAAAPARPSGTSAAEVQRLLAEADAKSEAKLSDLRFKVRSLERERNELEEDWASKLAQRVRELETLRRTLSDKEEEAATAAAARAERDARIDAADAARRELEREMVQLRAAVEEAHADVAVAAEAERAAREELATAGEATTSVQAQLDEAKALADKLRHNNKTLRDEMRKVQSSVQLLERQRNPGVGYWGASGGAEPAAAAVPPVATPPAPSSEAPSGSASPAPSRDEEEVNLEYLRNVILQFLEHKEMRPNLVRVLSVILRFTPQELRRLNAKLNT